MQNVNIYWIVSYLDLLFLCSLLQNYRKKTKPRKKKGKGKSKNRIRFEMNVMNDGKTTSFDCDGANW